jgi:hypothetical protein
VAQKVAKGPLPNPPPEYRERGKREDTIAVGL